MCAARPPPAACTLPSTERAHALTATAPRRVRQPRAAHDRPAPRQAYANNYINVVRNAARSSQHINLRVEVQFDFGDTAAINAAITTIQESAFTIILAVVFEVDFEHILRSASTAGLLEIGYQWILSDSVNAQSPSYHTDPLFVAQAMHGSILLVSSPADSEGYARLEQSIAGLAPGSCSDAQFEATEAAVSAPLNPLGAYIYDAVAAAALAIASAIDPNDGRQIHSALLNVSFAGSTGLVRFDRNGDRLAETAAFRLNNVSTSEFEFAQPMAQPHARFGTWSIRVNGAA